MSLTKSLFSAIVPATLALALMAGPALAGGEPPPPPNGGHCTPGFWKNHVDLWNPSQEGCLASTDGGFPSLMLMQTEMYLNARGGGGQQQLARR